MRRGLSYDEAALLPFGGYLMLVLTLKAFVYDLQRCIGVLRNFEKDIVEQSIISPASRSLSFVCNIQSALLGLALMIANFLKSQSHCGSPTALTITQVLAIRDP